MPLSYDARRIFSLFSMKYMGSCPLNRKIISSFPSSCYESLLPLLLLPVPTLLSSCYQSPPSPPLATSHSFLFLSSHFLSSFFLSYFFIICYQSLLPLLLFLTCYHLSFISSLFQLAIIPCFSPLSSNLLSSPLTCLSLPTCYHLLFLSSLF